MKHNGRVAKLLRSWAAGLLFTVAWAQGLNAQSLTPDCTASILNRSVQVNENGTFVVPAAPWAPGFFRVRVNCPSRDPGTQRGQSGYLALTPFGESAVGDFAFEDPDPDQELDPIPSSIQVDPSTATITEVGDELNLSVWDGSREITEGTFWRSSNSTIAIVTPEGVVRAVGRGKAVITAMNEGVNGSMEVTVDVPADTDGDGMPDDWEKKYGFNRNDPTDGPQDFDGDGLSNADEFRYGTNPRAIDTDHDGLMDGAEVQIGTNPAVADSDNDGLTDGQETARGMDPLSPDSDNDGILDGVELRLGLDPTEADPVTQVVGRVVDNSGIPASKASVTVFDVLVATTGSTGFFTLSAVPANRGSFVASARLVRNGVLFQGTSAELIPAAGGTTDAGVITLQSNSWTVSGTVSAHNQVVKGARVTIASGTDIRETTTDSDGEYTITNMSAGPITVTARDPKTGLRGRSTGSLQPGGSATINVQLGPYGTVTGTVYLPDGNTPVGSGTAVSMSGHYGQVSTSTDSLGNYTLDFVPIGSFRIDSSDNYGNRGYVSGTLLSTSQVVVVRIVNQGRGKVEGIVRSAGVPVADAIVTVSTRSPFTADHPAITDGNGHYFVDGVFAGNFTVRATTTGVPPLTGINSGVIQSHGEQVTSDIDLELSGSLSGTLVDSGGQPVPGAIVTLKVGTAAIEDFTDVNGFFEFTQLPFRNYSVDFVDPDTRDRAKIEAVTVAGDVSVGTISLNGLGSLSVTVRDAGNALVAGALVTATNIQYGETWEALTDANGVALIQSMLAGPANVAVQDAVTGLSGTPSTTPTVPLNGLGAIEVWLQAAGTIEGTIYNPVNCPGDPATPASGMTVKVKGPIEREATTGGDGRYKFEILPVGDYTIEVTDVTEARRARYPMTNIVPPQDPVHIDQHGEVETRDLTVVGIATVTGIVTRSDAQSAVGTNVVIRAQDPVFGGVLTGRVGFGERYTIERVPIGNFTITASAPPYFAQSSGEVQCHGEVVELPDLEMIVHSGIPLPITLYDANGFPYDIQPDGTLEKGSVNVFRGGSLQNRGAMQLDVISAGNPTRFTGSVTATTDQSAREIIINQQQLITGLTVTRHVYTKVQGYFTRYFDVLQNTTGTDVTIDVRITNNFRRNEGLDPKVIFTNGDPGLNLQDHWVVIDDTIDADPAVGSVPAVAVLFAGSGAQRAVSAVSFDPSAEGDSRQLISRWDGVTVPSGGKVAFLHVVVQQLSRAAAQAAAERLVQIPPEIYDGLSALEIGWIQNIDLPLSPAPELQPLPGLPSLPPLEGKITGTVRAENGTAIPDAQVSFRSTNALFGRQRYVMANFAGKFTVEGIPSYTGPWGPVPVDGFQLQARHPQTLTYSPITPGTFPPGASQTSQDVTFSATGSIAGVVKRPPDPPGNVVSSGTVKVIAGPITGVQAQVQTNGSYQFSAFPPGSYTLEATGPVDYLKATQNIEVAANNTTQFDFVLPPTGELEGTVTRQGEGVSGVWITLRGADGLALQTTTQTGGSYLLLDIPFGEYLLEAFDPVLHNGASTQVNIDGYTRVQQPALELQAGGKIQGTVRKYGLTVDGVQVFYSSHSDTTEDGGLYSFDNVPLGRFSVGATDPETGFQAISYGEITYSGETVTVDLDLIAAGSVSGKVYDDDGVTPMSGANVRVSNTYKGFARDTISDAAGNYSFHAVPVDHLHDYSVAAVDPGTGQRGETFGRMSFANEADVVDVTLNGVGTVIARVKDPDGDWLPGATVKLNNSIAMTNASGTATFTSVPAGTSFWVEAIDPITGLSDIKSVTAEANETVSVDLQMKETGTIRGRVYRPDGTPASNAYVRANFTHYRFTDENGYYEFRYLPLGSYDIRASWNNRQSRTWQVVLANYHDDKTQNLDLIAISSVDVLLQPEQGYTVSNMDVCVSSLNPHVSYYSCTRVNSVGPHRFNNVPAGPFWASARGGTLSGSANGTVIEDGGLAEVVVPLDNCPITLPRNLFDANNYKYDIQPHGGLDQGSSSIFNDGGAYLSLDSGGGSEEAFNGVSCYASLEESDREVVVTNSQTFHGLEVMRKVYVPEDGYFARYLEILTNPTGQAVTVDVIVKTMYTGTPEITDTSSGDAQAGSDDYWVAVDPTTAFVFGSPEGSLQDVSQVVLDSNNRTLSYRWDGITLQAGQTIILMHVVSQQSWEILAIRSAERLAQLPPELLQGLSAEEIALIVNFNVPAGGTSTVPPLEALPTGTVDGHVWAADGVTPVPNNMVLQTYHIFGGTMNTTTDANGYFSFTGVAVTNYTLTADAGLINATVEGDFEEGGQTTETQDFVMNDIGVIKGTVRDWAGEQADGVRVDLYPPNPPRSMTTGADGAYAFLIYDLNSWYSLNIIEPITGTRIDALPPPVVSPSSPVYVHDFHLPAVGYLNVHVDYARGILAVGSVIEINFGNAGSTNSEGDFTKALLAGSYTIGAFYPGDYPSPRLISPSTASFSVTTNNEQVNVTLTLPAAATIDLSVEDESENPVDAHVQITSTQTIYGEFVQRSREFDTTGGQISIPMVSQGNYKIVATTTDDRSGVLIGEILQSDDNMTVDVTLTVRQLSGTVYGRVVAADEVTPIQGAQVFIHDLATGDPLASSVLTDVDGYYQFESVEAGGAGFFITVHAFPEEGSYWQAEAVVEGQLNLDGSPVTVEDVIAPVTVVRGRFLYSDDSPVADEDQSLGLVSAELYEIGVFETFDYSYTNGDFIFLIPQIPDELTFTVSAHDDATQLSAEVTGDFGAPEVILPDIVLPVGVVQGTAEPNAEMSLAVSVRNTTFVVVETQADSNGFYSFAHVPLGCFEVYTSDARSFGQIKNPGDTAVIDFEFTGGESLTGTVIGTDDLPVAGASMNITYETGETIWTADTASDGSFSFSGIPAGRAHALTSSQVQQGVLDLVIPTNPVTVRLGSGVEPPYNLDGFSIDCDGSLFASPVNGIHAQYGPGSCVMPCPSYVMPLGQAGREVVIGPALYAGLRVTRKVFVPQSAAFVRYLEVLENPGSTSVSIPVRIFASKWNSFSLMVDPATTGGTYGIVSSGSQPVTAYVFAGNGAPTIATAVDLVTQDEDGWSTNYGWDISIPAGEKRILMHFLVQRPLGEQSAVETQAISLVDLSDPDATAGMTAEEKAVVVNFAIPQNP